MFSLTVIYPDNWLQYPTYTHQFAGWKRQDLEHQAAARAVLGPGN